MSPESLRQRLREGAPTIVAHHKGRRRIVSAIIAWTDHKHANARRYVLLWEVSSEPTKLVTPRHKAWLRGDRLPNGRSYRLQRVGITTIGDARMHGRAFAIRACGYLPEVRRETIALGVVADA